MTVLIVVVSLAFAALLAGAYLLFRVSCLRDAGFQPSGGKEEGAEPNAYERLAPVFQATAKEFMELQPERVSIESFDGLKLAGLFLPVEKARGTVIMMHGYRSTGLNDFSTSYDIYRELGLNVLIPDERACGDSEGKYITFGIRERRDCADWVRALNAHLGTELPIVLHGLSLGCATVLMTAGLELPQNVRCVTADCGFTSPKAIMAKVMKQWFKLPAFPLLYIAGVYTRLIAGFGVNEYSTLTAMKTNRLPVLFLHGENDDFVPIEMTRQNYAACKAEKELFTVPGAGHALSILTDRPGCGSVIQRFVERHCF